MDAELTSDSCKSCSASLNGKFCHVCGEKMVESSDFTLKTLIKQAFDGVTNIDSKIIKSFKYLFFKPGKLTENYVIGIRRPFMKPIQMFLVINVLFFFFLPKADILRVPSTWYFKPEYRLNKLNEMIERTGQSASEIMQLYDDKSLTYSKALVFVIIPFVAILMLLINFKKRYEFGKHIIFAIHYFSFFLVFCVCLLFTPFVDGNPTIIQTAIVGFNFIYLFFAIKTFYKDNNLISVFKSLIAVAGCMFIALQYREFVSDLSFLLINES